LLAFCYKLSTAARYDPAMFCRYEGIVLFSAAKSTRQGAFRLKSRPALTTEGR
jgi:hypothetical protein